VQELYIDCVKKDWNTGVITHASIGRTAYDVMQIVRVLLNKQYSAYTLTRIIIKRMSILAEVLMEIGF
jgi:hypothetical protein